MLRAAAPRGFTLALMALTLLLTPLLAVSRPQPAAAAGEVAVCDETSLRAALAGGGLVTFSCSGTITLASQLEITADTIIDGGGLVTLDGGLTTRLIVVNSGVALTLLNLTLTGGRTTGSGGAIYSSGALRIIASTFTDNAGTSTASAGGAIDNDGGSAVITASTFAGNSANRGGAIDNNGTLTLIASTFTGNTGNALSSHGGAIDNVGGSVTITASTFAGNSAPFGGAIHNVGTDGTLEIIASTFAGNTAANEGGAIYNSDGSVAISASTFSGNTATNFGGTIRGFGESGNVTVTASILSGSEICSGAAITSGGYNVSSDATCNFTTTGDVQNSDPLLSQLQNNGGPTQTMRPQTGSPAIDRVPADVCATLSAANDGRDQRGVVRPSGAAACDSGAVETEAMVPVWLIAALAVPDTILQGESASIVAAASSLGGLGYVRYSFACPSGTVGPQFASNAVCTFPEAGEIDVLVTAESFSGMLSDSATVTVSVQNQAPIVTITPDSLQIEQGETFGASGSFSDPGTGPFTATVDYGDGAGPQSLPLNADNTFNLSHVYLDQGDFPVTVEVCDANDACGMAAVTVQVGNAAPIIDEIRGDVEGSLVVLTVTASDPGGGPLTYRFECAGDVIGPQVSPSATCDYGNQRGRFPILVEVTDSDDVSVQWTGVVELVSWFCAAERSGVVTFHTQPGCGRDEQQLRLDASSTLAFCVGERSGAMQYVGMAPAACQRGEFPLLLPHDGPITICVGEHSRLARYVADASECNPRGELVYVIANRVVR